MTQLNKQEKQSLTIQVLGYLDSLDIDDGYILQLLGIEGDVKIRHLSAFRKGDKVLDFNDNVSTRIEHIIGIAEALRTTFPFNDKMRILWLKKPHRRFGKRPPLQVMIEDGISGLQKVRIDVDCGYGWSISEAMANQQQAQS